MVGPLNSRVVTAGPSVSIETGEPLAIELQVTAVGDDLLTPDGGWLIMDAVPATTRGEPGEQVTLTLTTTDQDDLRHLDRTPATPPTHEYRAVLAYRDTQGRLTRHRRTLTFTLPAGSEPLDLDLPD